MIPEAQCLQCGRPGFNPWVREALLEKAMAAHSSTLAWKIPWMEELVGYSPWRHKESDMTATSLSFFPEV